MVYLLSFLVGTFIMIPSSLYGKRSSLYGRNLSKKNIVAVSNEPQKQSIIPHNTSVALVSPVEHSSQRPVQPQVYENNKSSRMVQEVAKQQPIAPHGKKILVNKVSAIVHGPERSHLLTKVDYTNRAIDGRQHGIKELIDNELIYQDGMRVKMLIDDNIVKAHLRKVMQSFGLKEGDEHMIFAQEGFSYEEGFEQFRKMFAVNGMIEQHVLQHALASEDEIITYYNTHPLYKEASYLLQTGTINKAKEPHRKEPFLWSDSYWIKESELADDLKKLRNAKVGDIVTVEDSMTIYGYKLINKKEKREVSLAKRHNNIAEVLRQPKFEQGLDTYKKRLSQSATVIHLNPT